MADSDAQSTVLINNGENDANDASAAVTTVVAADGSVSTKKTRPKADFSVTAFDALVAEYEEAVKLISSQIQRIKRLATRTSQFGTKFYKKKRLPKLAEDGKRSQQPLYQVIDPRVLPLAQAYYEQHVRGKKDKEGNPLEYSGESPELGLFTRFNLTRMLYNYISVKGLKEPVYDVDPETGHYRLDDKGAPVIKRLKSTWRPDQFLIDVLGVPNEPRDQFDIGRNAYLGKIFKKLETKTKESKKVKKTSGTASA